MPTTPPAREGCILEAGKAHLNAVSAVGGVRVSREAFA